MKGFILIAFASLLTIASNCFATPRVIDAPQILPALSAEQSDARTYADINQSGEPVYLNCVLSAARAGHTDLFAIDAACFGNDAAMEACSLPVEFQAHDLSDDQLEIIYSYLFEAFGTENLKAVYDIITVVVVDGARVCAD